MMRQRTFLLGMSLILVEFLALPAMAGITLRASKPLKAEPIQIVSYLSDTNEALQRALLIHNVMNEMPDLKDVAQTTENFKKQGELLKEMQKELRSCNIKKIGKVFKNPQKVWEKMMTTYFYNSLVLLLDRYFY